MEFPKLTIHKFLEMIDESDAIFDDDDLMKLGDGLAMLIAHEIEVNVGRERDPQSHLKHHEIVGIRNAAEMIVLQSQAFLDVCDRAIEGYETPQ